MEEQPLFVNLGRPKPTVRTIALRVRSEGAEAALDEAQRRAAWMISPSFVLPFLMISAGAFMGILTGNFILLQLLSATMTAYGAYVCYLMLRRPEELAVEENHVSWAHMYRMMFVAQVGFALAYVF